MHRKCHSSNLVHNTELLDDTFIVNTTVSTVSTVNVLFWNNAASLWIKLVNAFNVTPTINCYTKGQFLLFLCGKLERLSSS